MSETPGTTRFTSIGPESSPDGTLSNGAREARFASPDTDYTRSQTEATDYSRSQTAASSVFEKSVGRRIQQARRSVSDQAITPKQEQPIYLSATCYGRAAFRIVKKPWFENFFFVCIALNALEMGLSLAYSNENNENMWIAADVGFAFLFAVETLVIILSYGHLVFCNFWHALQVFATMAAIGDCGLSVTGLGKDWEMTSRTLKSTRLLLMAKLFSMNKETRLIVLSMIRSLKSLRGVLIVILVICYGCTLGVYSVVGQRGDEYDELGIEFGDASHATYFGTIMRTMLTLFSMLILSEWDSVVRPIYDIQPYMVMFFICFTVFLTFGLMNVLVGIIVDTVNSIHQEHEAHLFEEKLHRQQFLVEQVVEVVFGDDDDITFEEFLGITEDSKEISDFFKEFKVPWGFTFGDLFCILDDDKDGHMSKSELADGLFSLIAGGETARFCLSQLHISRTHADLVQVKSMVQSIEATLTNMEWQQPSSENHGKKPTLCSIDVYSPQVQRNGTPKASAEDGSLWSKCYSTLHDAVEMHCKQELDQACERLQPTSNEDDLISQEHFVIRNKLLHAVSQESAIELRKAIDHAIAAGIDFGRLSLELTYNDMLKHGCDQSLPSAEVQDAMEKGDWSSALDMIIGSALQHGADKNMLASIMTRVAGDSGISSSSASTNSCGNQPSREALGSPVSASPNTSTNSYGNASTSIKSYGNGSSEPVLHGRVAHVRKFPEIRSKSSKLEREAESAGNDTEIQANLLTILHSEASKHSNQEMNKAWESLQAFKFAEKQPREKHAPLSQAEELFFIYNQMYNAVNRKSFSDLQRALNQAFVAGLDMNDMDAEVAYRDALARYQKGTAYIIRLASDAFRRQEWYLALDLLIQASLARGADRLSLLRAVMKMYADTRHNQHSWV